VGEWQGTNRTYGSRHYVEVAKRDGSLKSLKALLLVDMIADIDLRIRRESLSTRWLTDIIWNAAREKELGQHFLNESTEVEDDHQPFLAAFRRDNIDPNTAPGTRHSIRSTPATLQLR
jgi:hypothetical protein